MSLQPLLLDTDILSAVMRGNVQATERARTYLQQHRRFTFSEITRYEVLRGLLSKGAVRQQQAFEQLCFSSAVLPLTADIVRQAALIYADLYTRGELIGDADILIAATALTHRLAVATNNEAHFRRIPGLVLENWLRMNLDS